MPSSCLPLVLAYRSRSGLQCMIEADQPYCADVDECSDERDQFNKLHVGSSDNQHIPHLLSWPLVSCRHHYYCTNVCRCAATTPTASTRSAPSAASARRASTAGRRTEAAWTSTSNIGDHLGAGCHDVHLVTVQVCEQHWEKLLRSEHALQQHDRELHL